MAASRKLTRQALGALLKTSVTKAKEVYRYQETAFKAKSPIVVISSGSSARERLTMRGSGAMFQFDAHIFVLQKTKDGTWLNEQAEDLLDDIEQQICEAVDTNQRTAAWEAIKYADATDARDPVTIEGNTYLYESIPIAISVPK